MQPHQGRTHQDIHKINTYNYLLCFYADAILEFLSGLVPDAAELMFRNSRKLNKPLLAGRLVK